MKIRLFDTLTNSKRDFIPLKDNEVDIYYCGPTVYNYPHIGNMRSVVVFDVLTRFLQTQNYKVRCVRNYTDIDDKIINKALQENKTEKEISEFYIDSYAKTCDDLNVLKMYETPKVSNYMDKIINFIDVLLEKKAAYKAGDDVFFSTSSVSDYGCLSKMKIDVLEHGSRIQINSNKKNETDFVLWKKTDDNGIKFDAKFGKGRPGWHTECVVMVNSVFNKPLIDIHGGGFDLKFPHHENEIAQSMAIHNTKLANYWMHVGFVNVNNEKMSKSLNNDLKAKDIIEQYGGNALRMFFISTHYRSPINFTSDNILDCKQKIEKYIEALQKLKNRFYLNFETIIDKTDLDILNKFFESLADDLNISNALVYVEQLTKLINQSFRFSKIDVEKESTYYNTLYKMLDTLGFKVELKSLKEEDRQLFLEYNQAKANKNYELSDKLRETLQKKGAI